MSVSPSQDPGGHGQPVKMGSDRSFGLVFAAVFLLVGGAPLWHGGGVRWWGLGLAAAFLGVALARPGLLAPLNRVWFRFGLLLHRVVSPLVLGLLFFLVLTPFAVLLRLFGKDPMSRRFDPKASSYWIPRQPPGPGAGSMTQQF